MKKNENPLVILSNSIANAKFSFSIPTQKLLFFLISKITFEERKQGIFVDRLEFPLEEIYSHLKFSGREKSNDLKSVLKKCIGELGQNDIKISRIDKKGKEEWDSWSWKKHVNISESTGKFSFSFNDELSPLLLPMQNYFKSNLHEFLKLTSSHSISLYMLFRSNEFKNKIQTYYIEDLKEKLGVDYPRWIDFKKSVLDFSIEQLNKETNYFFSYEAKRIGRSIGKVEIRVIDKKEKEEFSDFFSEKIEEFLKEKKVDSNIRKRFELVKYEYDAKGNIIYIDYKDEASKTKIVEYYKAKNLNGENELKRFLDGFITDNVDFQKFLKNMFRKGVKVIYGK